MFQSTSGTRYEQAVVDLLRQDHHCDVFTSETLDFHHKVDAEIRSINGIKLRKVVQVQLTMRVGHFGKLRDYVSSRWLNTDIISLYVEAHNSSFPRETAEHIVWAAAATQAMEPYGRLPIFGLAISDGDAVFFDPYARLKELTQELNSTERFAALKAGMVRQFEENGFWIIEEVTQQPYFAQYIDVSNGPLRRRLRDGVSGLWVRFLPIRPGRAADVRKPLPRSNITRKA